MAEDLKPSRSTAKGRVSNYIRKLKSALQYGESNVSEVKVKLDDAYDNLCDIDLQISEIEEIESTYLNEITKAYEDALKLYFDSIKEDEKIKNKIIENDKKKNIERYVIEINSIKDRIHANITIEVSKCDKTQRIEIEEDQSLLSSKLESLLKEVSDLNKINEDKEIETKTNEIILSSNKLIRDS